MIKILRDFRGRASGERYFKENEVVELPEEFESALVMEGVAKKIVSEMKVDEPKAEAPKVEAPKEKKVKK